ncbi:hypothetical protein MLZ39_24200 [Escherichia coli]|nr:hypothetical protein [Escherichia coli]
MTTIKNRRLRPRAHRFALESRQLFDGAALAETAIHEASASDLVHHESATEPAKALDFSPHRGFRLNPVSPEQTGTYVLLVCSVFCNWTRRLYYLQACS